MDTQTFYRRVEVLKCILLSIIIIMLFVIYVNLPRLVTLEDIKQRNVQVSKLPIVVVKDGRITLENEEIKIRGNVTIDNQPIEVLNQRRYYSR